MLTSIREKLTGWAAAVILGIIALSLVVTFGNIDTGFTPAGTAFTVNGEDVPIAEFRLTYQRQRQEWESNFRAQMPDELAASMLNSVLDFLVRNRAIKQFVSEQGYRVSDGDVIASIQGNANFQVGGRFSQPAYEQLLAAQGFSPQRYEYEQRQVMEVGQYVEGIATTAFFTPAEFRRYISLDGESRSVEYVLLPASLWAGEVQVSGEAVAERYERNKSVFRSTETVSLEYIVVDYNELVANVDVSDAEARQYFEQNPQEFRGPDDRKVSHILVAGGDDAAAQKAEQVSVELDAGASFDDLAAEYSDDSASASRGGSLGWLGAGDAPAQEFEDAMMALTAPGEVSQPVQTEFGYHLIRLDATREGASLTYAEVAEDLQSRLREDQAADRYAELLDELDDRALESLDGLKPVADAMGLQLKSIDGFTRNGGGDLGFDPSVVDAAFSLEVLEDGENSPVVALADGRAVVLRVTSHQPPAIRPLEEVEQDIRAALLQEEAIALGAADTADMLSRLNSGTRPDEVLPEGISFTGVDSLRRGDSNAPAELAAAIFRAPKVTTEPSAYRSKLLASGEYALFRIAAVTEGQPDNYSLEDRDLRKRQLGQRLGNGQINAVVESLIADAEVQVQPDLQENILGTAL